MKRMCLALLCAGVLLSSCKEPSSNDVTPSGPETTVTEPSTVDPPEGYIIVGYATYWDNIMPDPTYLTHICYAFAHINPDFETLDIKSPARLTSIVELKKQKPGLKVLLSVGGWGAGNFSEMAGNQIHRKQFCESCAEAVEKYNLDGIDLDWEYPTSSVAGISASPSDTRNFTQLVKDLRLALGKDLLLTMASADNAKYVDFKSTSPYFSFVNLMTYDMGKPPKHNAALYPSSRSDISCEESVTLHHTAGVPYEKMVLGIPFFGHGDGKAFTDEGIDYRDINPGSYKVMWDDTSKVPYLADATGKMVLSYDDARSVGLKADYIKKRGLLGAMYWNIEADDDDWTLSKAIHSRLTESQ